MSKRGTRGGKANRHFVQLENQLHYLPAAKWHEWLRAGLLVLVVGNVATPTAPGVMWLQNGEVHEKQEKPAPFMNLNCRVIERHAIFDVRGPKLDPVVLQREIQRAYGGRS